MTQFLSFFAFTAFVAFFAAWQLRKDKLNTADGYFLGGRSLTGVVIAGSLLLTNISTEHLIGMNGSAYENGAIIIAWEVTSALALVAAAMYFVPRYLQMGLTTIPEFLEKRFDRLTRTIIAMMLIISFVTTLLPIVLYSGALSIESVFEISSSLGISQNQGLWLTVVVVGVIGSIYARRADGHRGHDVHDANVNGLTGQGGIRRPVAVPGLCEERVAAWAARPNEFGSAPYTQCSPWPPNPAAGP